MNLKFLDKGTNLILNVATSDQALQKEYKAEFYDLITDLSFLVEDEVLYKDFINCGGDAYLKISFFRPPHMYEFRGRVKKAFVENASHLTQIDQISSIEVSTRRLSPRHEISAPINISVSSENNAEDSMELQDSGDMLFSGKTFDISSEGLCILSNSVIDPKDKPNVLIELVLNKSDRFLFPAKLVRSGRAPQSAQFKYDFGFLFDLSSKPEEKTRLVTALFKHKASSY